MSSYLKANAGVADNPGDVELTNEELEALLLSDLQCVFPGPAAEKMRVSSETYDQTLGSAHRKVAEAIWKGRAVKINGDSHRFAGLETYRCGYCGRIWRLPRGADYPGECPRCGSGYVCRH
ncbi:MAG: DUF134 domain-containing protein [Bryobacteraceae bacterium]|nr:DUF134 domain-containing protein [Bryobacteraceae bacterium]